jgi:hypothetical protein
MAYGTVNADVIGTSVAGSNLGAGDASMLKNRCINGNMVIDQRNAGASGTITGYTVDRWGYNATQTSKITWQQNAGSVTLPVGFTNYLGFTSSSAYTVLTGDTFYASQAIEGYNIADLGWGTANAKTVTLSFQVYSSLTGTFGGALVNSAGNRSYPFSYTVSSANTWTAISVTIAGDTSGTWLTTNGVGIALRVGLGSGATYSGTAGAWAAGNYVQSTSSVSVVGTNGATFYITGVQLEVGSSATGYEYRQYGQELALCQRYYEVMNGVVFQCAVGGSNREGSWRFCNDKRTTPTITLSGSANTPITVDSAFTSSSIVALYNSTGTYLSTNLQASAEL